MVSVNTGSGTKELAAEEVSAMVLIKMKEIAEAYLGKEIKVCSFLVAIGLWSAGLCLAVALGHRFAHEQGGA